MKKLSPCYDQNLEVLRFSLDSFALKEKVIVQASKRHVLLAASIGNVTKSGRRHWETKALFTGTGTRKTWQLEVTFICFYCCYGYWDIVPSSKPRVFPKLTTPVPFPVVALWTPLSVSTMDVLIQTQPGVPIVTFPTLWTHTFSPNLDHILEQFPASAGTVTRRRSPANNLGSGAVLGSFTDSPPSNRVISSCSSCHPFWSSDLGEIRTSKAPWASSKSVERDRV